MAASGQKKKAGSKKDRQVMAHRRKHQRYATEMRRGFNKKRRIAKQRRKEEKKRVNKLNRVKK